MSATFISMLLSIIGLCFASLYPAVIAALTFPQTPFVCFFGLFFLVSLTPWRWVRPFHGGRSAFALSRLSMQSQLSDKRIFLYLLVTYFVAFTALIMINLSSIPALYRFIFALVGVGVLIDISKMIYKRLQYRTQPVGLADWLLESMRTVEQSSKQDKLIQAFESTFSAISAYVRMNDAASLKMFCLRIIDNADLWIRASSKLPEGLDGMSKEASVLDNYTIVEAMVAKRMSSVLQAESLIMFETLIWFEGRLALAFHGRHASLGYLLLFSLSVTLQQVEGKIDRTNREIEYITMLSEIIKALIDRTVVTRVSDRTSIFRTLALLEAHLKESFRADRSINPAFLMQPFAEVGQLIANEKYAQVPDRDDIIAELRRLLAQFAALEGVRAQMDIGVEGTDTKASYKEDKPFLSR